MSKKISPEIEQEIIKLYNSGLSMAKAGIPYNVSSATVMAILNRNNIPKRTKGGIYTIPEQEVITRYKNGESCQVIANSFKVTCHTISNILEKNNIARGNKYKNINLNENYFEIINSYDKAYFLGFMLTDGNISLNENSLKTIFVNKPLPIWVSCIIYKTIIHPVHQIINGTKRVLNLVLYFFIQFSNDGSNL